MINLNRISHHFSVLRLILLVQALFWLVIAVDIPVAREVLGFIYLSYTPGFLLLRLSK